MKQTKEEVEKDLKRQAKQASRDTKVKGLKVKDGKRQMLVPGKDYMVGAEAAKILVKAGRAEIVK